MYSFVVAIMHIPYCFSKSTKEVFSVHGAWHSQNMLYTMFHGQAFRIITWQLSMDRAPLSTIWGRTEHGSVGFIPGNLHLCSIICQAYWPMGQQLLVWISIYSVGSSLIGRLKIWILTWSHTNDTVSPKKSFLKDKNKHVILIRLHYNVCSCI